MPCFDSGLERKLKTAAEAVEQLSKDKCKLETDISERMKQSGDSSAQLTKMNEDLIQKERYNTILDHYYICKVLFSNIIEEQEICPEVSL